MSELLCYNNKLWKLIKAFSYTGRKQKFSLDPGTYLFECNGAEGGYVVANESDTIPHHYGGTTRGIITLDHTTNLVACVGGQGGSGNNVDPTLGGVGGWNFGGCGSPTTSTSYYTGNGGGGASDIRLDVSDNTISQYGFQIPNPKLIDSTEYREVKYVITEYRTGTTPVYYDTLFIPDANTRIQFTGYALCGSLFGCYKRFNITCENGNYVCYNMAGDRIDTGIICDTTIHTFQLDNEHCSIDNQTFLFTNVDIPADWGSYSLFLFNRSMNDGTVDTTEFTTCCMYSCEIYVNNTQTMCFIPCRECRFRYYGSSLYDSYGIYESILDVYHQLNENTDKLVGVGYDIIDPTLYARLIVAGGGGGSTPRPIDAKFDYCGSGGGIVGGIYINTGTYSAYHASSTKNLCALNDIISGNYISYDIESGVMSLNGSNNSTWKWYVSRMVIGRRYIAHCKITKEFASYFKIHAHREVGLSNTHNQIIEKNDYCLLILDFIPSSRRDYFSFNFDSSYWSNGGTSENAKLWDFMLEVSDDLTSNIEDIISEYESFNACWYADQTHGYSFGYGGDAYYSSSSSTHGFGGSGSGWFGGLTELETQNDTIYTTTSCGGGGSGYVLTSESYKPNNYMVSSEYYMTMPSFDSLSATSGANIRIYKLNAYYMSGDIITFPCVGWEESIDILPGTYDIECYGASGGPRYYYQNASHGGMVQGRLNISDSTKLYCNVGGSGYGTMFGGSSDYVHLYHPVLCYNGGGMCSNIGSVGGGAGGGATDFRLRSNQEENSLYTRIIVAGGGGGLGRSESFGGPGGGESGGESTSSNNQYGSGHTPGTQTSGYAFGYGNEAISINGGHGGAGGGGWYGGIRCYPDGSVDDDYGGGGGSGYVLTSNSYKPDGYIPDETYYMTSTVNIMGGNDILGNGYAIIKVVKCSPALMLCHDDDGFKYFDKENEVWELLPDQSATPAIFDQYGVTSFYSDSQLKDEYDVYTYTLVDLPISKLVFHVSPSEQHIIAHVQTNMLPTKVVFDIEGYYDEFAYSSTIVRDTTPEQNLSVHLYVDKLTYDDYYIRTYSAQLFGKPYIANTEYWDPTKSHKIERYDPEDPKWRDRYGNVITAQWLSPVGDSTKIDYTFSQYIGIDLHESVSNWEFRNVIACEYERIVYVACTVAPANTLTNNEAWLYIRSYSTMTGICKTEYLNKFNTSQSRTFSDLLVTDDKFYLSTFDNDDNRARFRIIDRATGNLSWSSYVPDGFDNIPYRFRSARGRMEWWDDSTIATISWNWIMLYNIKNDAWKYITINPNSLSNTSNVRRFYDFSVGKSMVCATDEPYYSTTYNCVYLFDKKTGEGVCIRVDGLNSEGSTSRYGLVQYHNGKFYVVYREALIVIDETTKEIKKTITGMPWSSPVYMNVYHNNVIIGTVGNKVYVYDMKRDRFSMFYSAWSVLKNMDSTVCYNYYNNYGVNNSYQYLYYKWNLIRTVVVGGYCFIPYNTMCIVNLTSNAVYEMGSKFNRYMIPLNESNVDNIEFDNRFVDLTESCLRIHNGEITFNCDISDYGSKITKAHVSKSQYKKIINIDAIL